MNKLPLSSAAHASLTVLLADPQQKRREHLVRRPGHHRVVEAASLHEVYQLAEALIPDALVLTTDFLNEPEFEGIMRLATLLRTPVIAYADQGLSTARSPQRAGVIWIARNPDDGLSELLARMAGSRAVPDEPAQSSPLPELILIGASTGGIAALETILSSFPVDCPPTLVVQHIRDGFIPRLVQRLDARCRARIVEATDGMALRRGTIAFAADDARHLTVAGKGVPRCALIAAEPNQGHRPAVDPLFESGTHYGAKVAAALLTGMGSDGARGLGSLRRAGALTIAQDQATSTVWGMPRVAVEIDAADLVLPLAQIGTALLGGRASRQGSATGGRPS